MKSMRILLALGAVAAMISAVLVGAVSVFSARMAGRGQGNNAWFVVPTPERLNSRRS